MGYEDTCPFGCMFDPDDGGELCCDVAPNNDCCILCAKCFSICPRFTCYVCKKKFCRWHGKTKRYECCGKYICGLTSKELENGPYRYALSDSDDEERDDKCYKQHVRNKKPYDCGHYGCNMQLDDDDAVQEEGKVEKQKSDKKSFVINVLKNGIVKETHPKYKGPLGIQTAVFRYYGSVSASS